MVVFDPMLFDNLTVFVQHGNLRITLMYVDS
jgi:hypothetical protein